MVFATVWIFSLLLTFINSHNFNSFVDYDSNHFKDILRVRTKFLHKKKQNEKIELFDKMNSNKTVFVNDILHTKINDLKRMKIEESFLNMLAMKGVKYIFKRDFFWRTLRHVEMENGNLTVVCYRCQNKMDGKCQNGGYWVIEEKPPPCPYEVLSLKTDWEICVANYSQYPDLSSTCPSVINRLDLKSACDNPIKTKWRVTRKYDKVSERNPVRVICQGRENCVISTSYTILPDLIIFRIINSTNHIFYSRVMKGGFKNYVCIEDCGRIDPKTDLISKNEQPYRLDLFKKNKREDFLSMASVSPPPKQKPCSNYSKQIKLEKRLEIETNFRPLEIKKSKLLFGFHMDTEKTRIKPKKNEPNYDLIKINNIVTKSPCKRLEEEYFEQENNRY